MMQKYCLGFIFNEDYSEVIVIEKLRPEWQKGKLNGIGGKVEEGESAYTAMIRECKEETGLDIINWKPIGRMIGDWGEVEVFKTTYKDLSEAKTMEEEKVKVILTNSFFTYPIMDSLQYFIPIALERNQDIFVSVEYY